MTQLGSLIAAGRTSEVFGFGRGSVVKVPRPEIPPHWAEQEATYTAAVHAQGLPTPEVKGLIPIEGRTSPSRSAGCCLEAAPCSGPPEDIRAC